MRTIKELRILNGCSSLSGAVLYQNCNRKGVVSAGKTTSKLLVRFLWCSFCGFVCGFGCEIDSYYPLMITMSLLLRNLCALLPKLMFLLLPLHEQLRRTFQAVLTPLRSSLWTIPLLWNQSEKWRWTQRLKQPGKRRRRPSWRMRGIRASSLPLRGRKWQLGSPNGRWGLMPHILRTSSSACITVSNFQPTSRDMREWIWGPSSYYRDSNLARYPFIHLSSLSLISISSSCIITWSINLSEHQSRLYLYCLLGQLVRLFLIKIVKIKRLNES